MNVTVRLTRKRLAVFGALAVLAAAGAAYAAIPDSSGVYTACALKATGTIRLIDPSLGSSSLLGHCTPLETQITWNQRGQNGQNGQPGQNGQNGVGPTVAQLNSGDSHCPAGGASLTDASGNVAYVCTGQNGVDGKSFTGSFTSANGQFSLDVADDGVNITGPNASISLSSTGDLTITAANATQTISGDATTTVGHDDTASVGNDRSVTIGRNGTEVIDGNGTETVHKVRSETVDQNETIKVGGDRSANVSGNDSVKVGGAHSENVGGSDTVTVGGSGKETVGGPLDIAGSFMTINGGTACHPAARALDQVDSGLILTGSTTVCIGG